MRILTLFLLLLSSCAGAGDGCTVTFINEHSVFAKKCGPGEVMTGFESADPIAPEIKCVTPVVSCPKNSTEEK